MLRTLFSLLGLSVGILLLFLALLKTYKLIKIIKGSKHERAWTILMGLIVSFLVGYITLFFMMDLQSGGQTNAVLDIILFLGSIFVWLVVRNGYITIHDLYKTSVSKQYVENIIQSMADTLIVVQLDPESRIKTVNKATLNLLGYSEEELLQKPVDIILDTTLQKQKMSNGTKDAILEEEVFYKTKSNKTIPMLYSVSEVNDLNGRVEGFILVGKDYRKIKEAQQALEKSEQRYKQLSEELAMSNTLKELLLDIITHDIKNPVGVIQGVSEMINDENPEDEGVELILNSTERLIQVLKNATILSKVAMHERIELEQMDVSQLLDSVIEVFKPTYANVGLTIDNQVGAGIQIQSNPVIEEVFTNYLSNAAKYAAQGKKLVISCVKSEKKIRLNFADEGKTIGEDQRESVFLRSIQLEEGKKRGRGLGLAIVKYIAESLNGTVGVVPNLPTGNIFYLELAIESPLKTV